MISNMLPAPFLIVNTSEPCWSEDALAPFAAEELMCRRVGEGAKPLVHIWRHKKAFVLGMRDRRLPYAEEAMARLERDGYAVAVRHSGGAAVPLDPGVVNVSFIFPRQPGETDFRSHFETVYRLFRSTLRECSPDVHKGEIAGSYCPGDYDLGVGGRKFCGLAQRRQIKAFIVQAFVVVEGEGAARADRVRQFYQTAAAGLRSGFPQIIPHRMVSLQEICGMRVPDFIRLLTQHLAAMGGEYAPWEAVKPDSRLLEHTIIQLRNQYDKKEK